MKTFWASNPGIFQANKIGIISGVAPPLDRRRAVKFGMRSGAGYELEVETMFGILNHVKYNTSIAQ